MVSASHYRCRCGPPQEIRERNTPAREVVPQTSFAPPAFNNEISPLKLHVRKSGTDLGNGVFRFSSTTEKGTLK
jgi:hypothetical protein